VNCLCEHITRLDNSVHLLVIQHPAEENHPKGTGKLTVKSLNRAQLMVTECLTEQQVEAFLRNKHNVLLYPHTDDFEGTQVSVADVQSHASNLPIQLIVLDGTWKKARKILYLNPVLASLPRLAMTAEWTSNYQIRKQKNAQSFSTIEAVGLALSQLEQDSVKYQPLFSLLEALNQQFERYR